MAESGAELDGINGDINRDGKIDHQDLELLRTLVRNASLFENLSSEQKALLDLNHDGVLNYDDVIQLIELIQSEAEQDSSSQGQALRQSVDSLRDRLRR